jgi:hypothetical protein
MATAWNCEWSYFEGDKNCILFRARYWWLEDAADVPQPLLDELTTRLGPGKTASFDDLVLLSNLSDAQVYKLVNETRLLPAAANLLPVGVYTGTGAKMVLQFYGQLPPELQKRARSPEGLSLADVDPELVARYLHRTLSMWAGAPTPAERRLLRLEISNLGGPDDPGGAGYRIWVYGEQGSDSKWRADIRLPVRPPG